jgi:FkbM family methyltransferase
MRGEVRASSSERGLDDLLAESTAEARRRVLSHALRKDVPLVLYGAGNLGQSTARRLQDVGVEPLAFADDTPGKEGLTIAGIPVLSPQVALATFGAETIFVVTIHNPVASFLKVQGRLQQLFGAHVISFLALAWAYPDAFLPYLQFELPQAVLAKATAIRRAFDLLADEESRRQFVAHLKFRLRLDFPALPESAKGDYFPPDVLAPLPADATFVDCGAFDGDTVRLFLAHQSGRFGRIFAFEPDARNYQSLCDYVAGLDEPTQRRIIASCASVGARREKLSFSATGDTDAGFSETEETQVDVVPLHEVIPDDAASLFIKIDVEGAEGAALAGAAQLIRGRDPIIAVCIYHRPDDLWQLPMVLHAIEPAHRLFIRTLGEDGMDVVCFAVPQHRVARHSAS